MGATLTTLEPIMKDVYGPRIVKQLNDEVTTLKRIQRSGKGVSQDTGGKYVTFPIHTKRNSGIGARHESEALPGIGQQGHAAARVGLKSQYGGVKLTGQSIAMSDTDPKAFAKALDNEVNGLKNDFRKDLNRQVYGSGNGAIGVIKTTTASDNTFPVVDGRLFQYDEVVDIILATSPWTARASGRTITAIDLTSGANTITVDGAAVSVTAADIVVRAGSGPSAGGNRELTGLDGIIGTGKIYNIDPATEPVWKSEIDSNSGTARALSEGLMIQMADAIRTHGGSTSVIFESLGVRRAYFNLLSQTRQTVNTQKFEGGFSGLAFTTDSGEIPVVADVDAPLGQMHFVNEEALTFYRDEEAHWLDRDGSMWKQVRDSNGDYDAWYARLVEYHELGCDRRNTHGRIEDITEA